MHNPFLRSRTQFLGLIDVIIIRITLFSEAMFRHYCNIFGIESW